MPSCARLLVAASLAAQLLGSNAQSDRNSISISFTGSFSSLLPTSSPPPNITYSGSSQSTVSSESSTHSVPTSASGSRTPTHGAGTTLVGSRSSLAPTRYPASSLSSAPMPSNSVACNGHSSFCNRQYSNITQICSHNSAFSVKNNLASNQEYDINTQLNDGVRMST